MNPFPFPRIHPGVPAVLLAPMEGLIDAPVRELLCERGGFSFAVSEFIRVSQAPLPAHAIAATVPELERPGCVTAAGVAVQVQLLGSDPAHVAETARIAVAAGARGIDLNFGCPSPVVNRRQGGAALLREPARLAAVVRAVREALPREIPVSAKLRLGWENPEDIHETAPAAAEAGADWLVIHGRTKAQVYRPPALWKPIGEIRRRVGIPVVANGDLFTLEDFRRCREETGCEHFMLGRGVFGEPDLPRQVAQALGIATTGEAFDRRDPRHWEALFRRYAQLVPPGSEAGYLPRRIKHWIRLGTIARGEAPPWAQAALHAPDFEALIRSLHSA